MINNDLSRTLIQNTSDIVIYLKKDFCILIFNQSAQQLYQWKPKDVLGRNFLSLCQENGYPSPILSDFFQNPNNIETKQYLRNEKGSSLWVFTSVGVGAYFTS